MFSSVFVLPENAAFNKPASMSSRLVREGIYTPLACAAVNGRTEHFLRTGTHVTNCFHSAADDYSAWWLIDLERTYYIRFISIHPMENPDEPNGKRVLTRTNTM